MPTVDEPFVGKAEPGLIAEPDLQARVASLERVLELLLLDEAIGNVLKGPFRLPLAALVAHATYLDSQAIAAVEGEATLNLAGEVRILAGKTLGLENAGGTLGVILKQVASGLDQLLIRNKADSGLAGFLAKNGQYDEYCEALYYRLDVTNPADLTISGGAVTQTHQFHNLLAETGTTDDLDTLTPIAAKGLMIYLIADTGDTITLKHGTGNLQITGGSDLVLVGSRDMAIGAYDPIAGKWYIK